MGPEKPSVGAVIMRVGPWAAGSASAAYVLTTAGTDVVGLTKIASFLMQFGGYGVAAIILIFLIVERQERLATQRSKDELMSSIPRDMATLVRENNVAHGATASELQELRRCIERIDPECRGSRPLQKLLPSPNGSVE